MAKLFYRPNARHSDALKVGIRNVRFLTSKYFYGPESIEEGRVDHVYLLADDPMAEQIRAAYEERGASVELILTAIEAQGADVAGDEPDERWPLRMPPQVYAARFPNGPHAELARALTRGEAWRS